MQEQPGGTKKPSRFWSMMLNAADRNYDKTHRECLAVVWASTYNVHIWRIIHCPFVWATMLWNGSVIGREPLKTRALETSFIGIRTIHCAKRYYQEPGGWHTNATRDRWHRSHQIKCWLTRNAVVNNRTVMEKVNDVHDDNHDLLCIFQHVVTTLKQ